MRRAELAGLCAAVVALGIAACGGGSGTTTPSTQVQTASVVFEIAVPTKPGSSHLRHPKYVSPNVQSVKIAYVPIPPAGGATSVTANLVAGSSNCSGTPLVCTATLKVPVGLDNFTISTYASTGGNGSQLSVGSLSSTIVSGANSVDANTVNLTLNGVVASFSLALTPATIGFGNPVPVAVGVEARDATGAVIIGPGNFNVPITLQTPDPYVPGAFLNAKGQDAFGPGQLPLQIGSPGSAVTLTAVTESNGQVLPGLTSPVILSGTAPGIAGAPYTSLSISGIPTRGPGNVPVVNPSSLVFASVQAQTQTFSVSEPNYSGTFTVSVDNPAILTTSQVPNVPNTFFAFPVSAGATTMRVTDQFGATTTVPVSVKGVITINPPQLQFQQGGGPQQATVSQPGTSSFSAASQNAAVATVSPASGSGPFTITPVGFGFTTIVFTNDIGQTAALPVTVNGAVTVNPSILTYASATSPPQSFTASASGATTYNATSLDPTIATVTATGGGSFKVSPVNAGTTAITVSTNNGKQGVVLVYVDGVVIIIQSKERHP